MLPDSPSDRRALPDCDYHPAEMPRQPPRAQTPFAVVDRLGSLLFDDGWRFFLPYLACYLVFRGLELPVRPLRDAFVCLHLVLAPLLLRYAWSRRSSIRAADALYWLGLTALFVLPGVYLEFPSDAWEHVRRIYKWGATTAIAENRFADRFPYFWSWSLIGELPPGSRRPALAVLGGFFQLLVSYQLFRLARRLGAPPAWARLQVLGVVCFFGNLAFGFLRYYSLASTSVAYAAYLHALILGLDAAEGRWRRLPELGAVLALVAWSHLQELLLFGISCVGLAGHALWRVPAWRDRLSRALPQVAAIGLLLGAATLQLATFTFPPTKLLLVPGVPGGIALLLGVLLWPRLGALSTLCLTPALLITFPPTLLIFTRLLGPYGGDLEWRALYAFPSSFVLVAAARLGLAWLGARAGESGEKWRPIAAAALAAGALAVALQPAAPWYGRLWFALHQPAPGLSLEFTDAAAQWLESHRIEARAAWREQRRLPADARFVWKHPPPYGDEPGSCLLLTDKATAFGLGAQLGSSPPTRRRTPPGPERLDLEAFLRRFPVCGFLVPRAPPEVAAGLSPVARISVHWDPNLVRWDLEGGLGFDHLEEGLAARGWTRTAVPPFYALWEPPGG
jgi:hypothetical protein